MAPATIDETVERLGELRDIHEIVPSPLNPRQTVDKTRLDELAASIAQKGIIEPLIVRSRPGLAQLEIIAGERRFRAARIAGLKKLPVIIRTLSDVEVLELMAIENSQRDDLHPLEEAGGYVALMKLDPAYTPKAIAAKIGKSERYVQQRLSLGRLEPEAKKAFLANHLTAGHADLISRLTPANQKDALKACFHNLYGEDQERGCISVRQLDRWIDDHVRLQLEPKNPELETLPELGKLLDKTEEPETLLQVHQSWGKDIKGALAPNAYKLVDGKKDRCPQTERAVVVLGNERGEIVDICRAHTTCKKHFRFEMDAAARRDTPATARKRPAAEVAKEKRSRLWGKVKPLALLQARKHGDKLTPGVLQVLAYGVLRYHYNGQKLALVDIVEAAAKHAAYEREEIFTRRVAKPLGINMAALFKAGQPGRTQTSARKKGTKKGRSA